MGRTLRGLGVLAGLVASLAFAGPARAQDKGDVPAVMKRVGAFRQCAKDITVWEWAPTKPGKYPGIVLLHGIDGLDGVNEDAYGMLCKTVAEKGYIIHLVHYMDATNEKNQDPRALEANIKAALLGPPNPENQKKVRALYETWMAVAKAGVGHLRHRDYGKNEGVSVDGDKIVLVGCSLGGFLAMSVAVQEQDLKLGAVVNLFGGLPKEFHDKVDRKLPPVLVVHSEKDQIVPCKECCDSLLHLLMTRGASFETKIFPATPHMFIYPNGTPDFISAYTTLTRATNFMQKHLNGKEAKAP